MATRSVISKIDKKVSNGEITAVYCHSDGYLNWNGKILNEHYTSGNKVDELLSNGGISILNENIGKPGLDFSDYKKFQSSDEQIADRSSRNSARRIKINNGDAKVGDGKDVDHKDGNPRNNKTKNLRMTSPSKNRGEK